MRANLQLFLHPAGENSWRRLRRMEAAEGAEVRARGWKEPEPPADAASEARAAGDAQCGPPLSGTSYWLDFWLFILFDVLLFVCFYLLP